MLKFSLLWSILTLSCCLALSAESIVEPPSSSSLVGGPSDRSVVGFPTPQQTIEDTQITVVIESWIREPGGGVSQEHDIFSMTRKEFEKKYRKLDEIDERSLSNRGYVKQVILRVRGTF